MAALADVLAYLRPGANFADVDGTLAAVRWDSPVTPPTAEEVAEASAYLDDPVPAFVLSGDFKRALYELGWYDDVDAACAAAGGLAEILWKGASRYERDHPLVTQIAASISKTNADIDDLFRRAATFT